MIAVGTNQNMIYLGDHEIQGIYAGDLLIYPDTPEPPTPTGSTYTLNTVYHATANTLPPLGYNGAVILHKQYIQSAYNTDILTKAELSGGTEIPINTTYTEFTTSGNNIVNYTFTGSTLTPNLFMETDLVSIAIPSGVTEIQYDCFWGCNRLTAVTISDSVTTIGSEAFGQCILLPTITIPSGVTSIGVRVFSGCTGMQEMIFQGTTPPTLGSDGLGSTGYTFPIYVPCEAVETYKTAYPAYASRITCVQPSQYEILSSLTADGTFQIPVDIPGDYLTSGTAFEYRFTPINTASTYNNIFIGSTFGVGYMRIYRGDVYGKSFSSSDWKRTSSQNPDGSSTVNCYKTANEILFGSEESDSYYSRGDLTASTAQDTSTPRFFPTERINSKYAAQGVFYYLKLGVSGAWDDDNLTAHFVPARDTSNNTLGVLDLVSNTFFPEIPNS